MGYRSDIAAVFYAADVKDFAAIKLWLDENFPKSLRDYAGVVQWFNKGMSFESSGIKWYDSYPDVIAFDKAAEEFIDLFCTGREDVPIGAYEFVRIGEDYEDMDVVREGEHEYVLEINRSVSIGV
jgi:hypothetical protein